MSIFSLIGAVGVVAVQAVLTDRRVLPEERAALLGVAGVAVLVDRGLQQHLVVRRAVRVVAARALHLALAQRHVAGADELGLLLQVAARAQLHLRRLQQRLDRRRPPSGAGCGTGVQATWRLSWLEPIQCFWPPLLWQSMQTAEESTELRVLKTLILVLSPPASAWALPGPWQPSQPFAEAMCGVVLNAVHHLLVALDAGVHARVLGRGGRLGAAGAAGGGRLRSPGAGEPQQESQPDDGRLAVPTLCCAFNPPVAPSRLTGRRWRGISATRIGDTADVMSATSAGRRAQSARLPAR